MTPSGLLNMPLVSRYGERVFWGWRNWQNLEWQLCLHQVGPRRETWCGQGLHDLYSGVGIFHGPPVFSYSAWSLIYDGLCSYLQATSGSGGWPMSVWLTPDLRPFIGGTYFPPRDHGRRPGLKTLLMRIIDQVEKVFFLTIWISEHFCFVPVLRAVAINVPIYQISHNMKHLRLRRHFHQPFYWTQ